jgi:hypothetical protein
MSARDACCSADEDSVQLLQMQRPMPQLRAQHFDITQVHMRQEQTCAAAPAKIPCLTCASSTDTFKQVIVHSHDCVDAATDLDVERQAVEPLQGPPPATEA